MGRQFRLYLLPVDADDLLTEMKRVHGLRIMAPTSRNAEPVEVASATSNYTRLAAVDMFMFGQYLLAPTTGTAIPMEYIERQEKWHVDFERSETIEFSTCAYGAGVLREGRFYYRKDMLSASNNAILAKNADFIAWAERMFRTAKKLLRYSQELDAYVGPAADLWRQQGGKLITGFSPTHKPIYSSTH